MGGVVCGLVQPPTPAHCHQIRDAPSAHSGTANAICKQRADVYEKTRHTNPTRWSSNTRCWSQPAEVWINKPTEELKPTRALPLSNPPEWQLRCENLPKSHRNSASSSSPADRNENNRREPRRRLWLETRSAEARSANGSTHELA